MEIISREESREKNLNKYFTGKPCKYGHISERYTKGGTCVECKRIHGQSDEMREYKKRWRKENFEEISERKKKYRQDNAEQIREYRRQYYIENYERTKENMKRWHEENKEHRNRYTRNRYATDEDFKTLVICRNMLNRTLVATSSTKDSRTYEILGYSNAELKESIESKFLDGMSWDSHGNAWHMDHVYPISRYISEGVTDPSIINALDNLIPMWAEHNFEKKAQTLTEYLDTNPELYDTYGHFIKEEDQ